MLERATGLELSAHKVRGFFKRWLELESRHGTAKTAASVRAKAEAYVKSLEERLRI